MYIQRVFSNNLKTYPCTFLYTILKFVTKRDRVRERSVIVRGEESGEIWTRENGMRRN
jgi:hypothetical protein